MIFRYIFITQIINIHHLPLDHHSISSLINHSLAPSSHLYYHYTYIYCRANSKHTVRYTCGTTYVGKAASMTLFLGTLPPSFIHFPLFVRLLSTISSPLILTRGFFSFLNRFVKLFSENMPVKKFDGHPDVEFLPSDTIKTMHQVCLPLSLFSLPPFLYLFCSLSSFTLSSHYIFIYF